MSLWWLQPGWTETCCVQCGQKIYPEGDPDWGLCAGCFGERQAREQWEREEQEREREDWERREMEEYYRKHPHG